MTISLDLPRELEHELSAEAERLGLPVAEYALRVLSTGFRAVSGTADVSRSGADVVAYWRREGLAGSRPEMTDPSGHARRLRDVAEHRVRG